MGPRSLRSLCSNTDTEATWYPGEIKTLGTVWVQIPPQPLASWVSGSLSQIGIKMSDYYENRVIT